MKRFLLSAVVLLSVSLNAQEQGKVGINTENPKATLDVNGDLKVSSNIGKVSQKDVLTVLENGKVGIDIKDFKTNSSSKAKLQVNGLIQSKTISTIETPNVNRIVVTDDDGVLRSMKISTLVNKVDQVQNSATKAGSPVCRDGVYVGIVATAKIYEISETKFPFSSESVRDKTLLEEGRDRVYWVMTNRGVCVGPGLSYGHPQGEVIRLQCGNGRDYWWEGDFKRGIVKRFSDTSASFRREVLCVE